MYSSRPTVDLYGSANGLCHYYIRSLAKRTRFGKLNVLPNITAGRVAPQNEFESLTAVFDHIQARERSPIIGTLLPGSDVFHLEQHMCNVLAYEIYGQMGRPHANQFGSRWVTPHITLSEPMQPGTEELPAGLHT